jgi:hypothetical protein
VTIINPQTACNCTACCALRMHLPEDRPTEYIHWQCATTQLPVTCPCYKIGRRDEAAACEGPFHTSRIQTKEPSWLKMSELERRIRELEILIPRPSWWMRRDD